MLCEIVGRMRLHGINGAKRGFNEIKAVTGTRWDYKIMGEKEVMLQRKEKRKESAH